MADVFTIHSSALPGTAQLAGFHGSEGLSRLYRFDIFVVMTNDVGHDFDLEAAVGAKATLQLETDDGQPSFVVNGIFASMELVSDFLGRSVFRAVLVPRFWQLTQSMHSRMFTQQALPAILAAVLDKGGLAGGYTLQLLGSYATEEHVCQYHESDFDFVSRWMEREGLYYYFEQDDGEERLIITDTLSTHQPLGGQPVRYYPQDEGVFSLGRFRAFTCRHNALPGSVRLKDYDYSKPTFEVTGQAPVSPSGVGEISVYGSRFFTPGEGAHLAQVKAQSLLAGKVVYQGSGTVPTLRPGYTFELEDHPRAAFNTTYLTTELQHWANRLPGVPELARIVTWDDPYRVDVTAIPSTVQYRAPQQTAWPRIYGGEHAVIDGPSASDYAQIDSHGRYAVKFHFDESDLSGGKASTWVRMLQPHGGGVEGFHFPLRVGTEVVCTFSGGDPDRPFIVGVAPNALTPSPVTSSNNTRNVIQTGGRNRWELEDKAGQERITMSTPHQNSYVRMGAPNDDHTMTISTDGPTLLNAGQDLDITAGGSKLETITGPVVEIYKNTKAETVTSFSTEAIGGYKKVQVGSGTSTAPGSMSSGDSFEEVFGDKTLTVHGETNETYDEDRTMTVSGKYVTHVTKNSDTTTTGDFINTILGSNTTNTYGASSSYVKGKSEAKVDGELISIANDVRVTTTQGLALTTVFGGSVTNVIPLLVSGTEGMAVNGVFGVRLNLTGPWQHSLNWGLAASNVYGISLSNIFGGKFEDITGFKFEVVSGVNVKNTTVDLMVAELHTKNAAAAFDNQTVKLGNRALNILYSDLSVTG